MYPDLFLYILNKKNIIIIIKLYSTDLNKDNKNKINSKILKFIIILPLKYIKFKNIFNQIEITKLLKYKSNINHKINLLPKTKLLYKPLYNIFKLELAILKDYIKINFISNFI